MTDLLVRLIFGFFAFAFACILVWASRSLALAGKDWGSTGWLLALIPAFFGALGVLINKTLS